MNREIAESEQMQKNSNENANEKSGGSKGKGKGQQKGNKDGKSREPNPCKTHDGQHNWRDCPNNPCSNNFKGKNNSSKGDKAKSDSDKKMAFKGNPTRNPTSFKSKSHSNQKRTQSIIMTLWRIQKVTRKVTISQ
jgi:hypothetical protein